MSSGAQLTLDQDFRTQLLDHELRHDSVTGLPNQASVKGSIRQLLDESALDGRDIVVVWVDVLNLRREYSVGGGQGVDHMIRAVADALRPWVHKGELIARFSDRCFLLALKRDERTGARLSAMVESALHLEGLESKPEIAAGAALFPQQATNAGELIRFASLAAISAARTRSRKATLFQPEMNKSLLRERALEKDLRAAIRERQITLAYQPQIDLVTGDVSGVECLARWNHPTRGQVAPAQFIPVAERSSLIDEIFHESLRQLLKDAAVWRAAGVELPTIAVNASAANIRREDFVATVARELMANPLGETQLEVEVTESLLMDDEELFSERLRGLRSIGVQVSLDDFGTRYTGFNALKDLPLNSMKIDKCFVREVNASAQSRSLCRTIVTMARHLNLRTVAEGIEHASELEILKKLGCDAAQGFLFHRPIPAEQFLPFLREWPEQRKHPEFDGELADPGNRLESDEVFGVA